MTADDALSLSFWSALSLLGLILVILGVLLEGAEVFIWTVSWFRRKRLSVIWNTLPEPHIPRWAHRLDHIGWFILVVGLALETWGHIRVTDITGRENRRLTEQLESTTKIAGDAIERASVATNNAAQAIEKAAKFDFARAIVESNNLILRSNIISLELKLQPRRITLTQVTNFVFLTEKIYKIPIRIHVGGASDEAVNYARQIREMLDDAHFEEGEGANYWRINVDGTLMQSAPIKYQEGRSSIQLFASTTNLPKFFPNYERTNGIERVVITENNTNMIYWALFQIFKEVGISGAWNVNSDSRNLGDCEFVVNQKN